MTRAIALRSFAVSLTMVAAGSAPAFDGAWAQTPPIASAQTYVALAMADGPTPDDRLALTFRGTNATDVVSNAVRACYERAAPGYMHTCQIWYGAAWVVGTVCRQSASDVKFAIGDDRMSPEAAAAKAIAHLRDVENADVSDCRVVAQTNADEMQVARSAAKTRPR